MLPTALLVSLPTVAPMTPLISVPTAPPPSAEKMFCAASVKAEVVASPPIWPASSAPAETAASMTSGIIAAIL